MRNTHRQLNALFTLWIRARNMDKAGLEHARWDGTRTDFEEKMEIAPHGHTKPIDDARNQRTLLAF
jgi:hypothetical protein